MAEVSIKDEKNKNSKKLLSKKSITVDLTPMVDLGFLLITFFIVTTSLVTPAVAKLSMPKDSKENTEVCESCTLTLLPQADNKIAFYEGIPENNTIPRLTTFAENGGLRDLIQTKQLKVLGTKGSKEEMVVIIKPGKSSSYKNVIDILDEMRINNVTKYFVTDEEPVDKKILQNVQSK